MKNNIIIVSPEKKWGQDLSAALTEEQIPALLALSIINLEQYLSSANYVAAILDIDLLPIDNRMIRKLTLKYQGVAFLCVSAHRFHPELKDAICYHIYACIQKPVDMTELLFFVRSIYKDSAATTG